MGAERMMKPTMEKNDLISRSDFLKEWEGAKVKPVGPSNGSEYTAEVATLAINTIIKEIKGMPTVDAAPVVHGRWDFSGVFGGNLIYQCNLCGRIIVLHEHGDLKKEFPHCHCGARMDGKEDENESR